MQLALLTGAGAVVAATVEFIQLAFGSCPSLHFSVGPFFPALSSPLFILLHFCEHQTKHMLFSLSHVFSFGLSLCVFKIFGPYYNIKVCASVYASSLISCTSSKRLIRVSWHLNVSVH